MKAFITMIAALVSFNAFAADEFKTVYDCHSRAMMDTFTHVVVTTGGFAGITTATVTRGFLGRRNKEEFVVEVARPAPGTFPVRGVQTYIDAQTQGNAFELSLRVLTRLPNGEIPATMKLNGEAESLSCKAAR